MCPVKAEPPGASGCPRNPNPRACSDFYGARSTIDLEGRLIERPPILLTGQAERLTQASWTAAEQARDLQPSTRSHQVQADNGLNRSDEDRAPCLLLPTDEVKTPVDAVGPVDVGSPGRSKHGCVPRCESSEAVRRWIGGRVRARFITAGRGPGQPRFEAEDQR